MSTMIIKRRPTVMSAALQNMARNAVTDDKAFIVNASPAQLVINTGGPLRDRTNVQRNAKRKFVAATRLSVGKDAKPLLTRKPQAR